MRLLFLRNLFIFSSSSSLSSTRPLLLQVSHFSASSNYPSSSRRHDDDSRNVRVSVWWDFENCNVPADTNIFKVAQSITEAVRANGIKGPVQITAFGDVVQLTRAKQEALSATGIILTHIPNGGKNSADRSLLVDLMYWVSQNPPPAHLFLISGDRDFANILHRLRMNNYNVLLASSEKAPSVLCSAATIMWYWNSLLKGENLTGKHFNHPPDGPYGSWYGHHKVPLEDPFPDGEHSTCSQIEEISELRPIPKAVLKQVRRILCLHPNGIPVSDLRAELAKSGMCVGKDYYGYRKFSRFLLSLPRVRIRLGADGNLLVHLAHQKSPEPIENNVLPSTISVDNEELNPVATSKLNGEGGNMVTDVDGTTSMTSSHELSAEDIPKKVQQSPPSLEAHVVRPPNEVLHSSPGGGKVEDVANAQVAENQWSPKESEILSSSDVSQSVPEKLTTSEKYSAEQSYTIVEKNGISEKFKAEDSYVKATRKEADAVIDKRIGGSTETYSNTVSKSITLFGWIRSWLPFWKSGGNSDDLTANQNKMVSTTEEPKLLKLNQTVSHSKEPKLSELKQTVNHSEEPKLSELQQTVSHFAEPNISELKQTDSRSEETELSKLKQTVSHSEEPKISELKQTLSHSEEAELSELIKTANHSIEPELFSSNTFWSDLESFVFTSNLGSILVSQSRSRKDMADNFQRYGPRILRSLSENNLLQLVDWLISEKKWLEERPSQTFPFMLTPPVGKSPTGQSLGANGLRSLFLGKTKQSNLQKSHERDVDKQYQSIPHTGVSSPATNRKHTERSKNETLADIQKLVSEILSENPDGYKMCSFRKLFLERYGYPLEVQKVGYRKLVYLLQIMPGVKIESSNIFPADDVICAPGLETSILNTQETNKSDAVSNSDSELSDSSPKDDSNDSPWEELGPVSVSNSNQSDLGSKLRREAIELETSVRPDYEPSLSDDDSSESEGDSFYLTQPEGKGRPKLNENDSSLLQTLESWYSSKEEEDSVKKSDNSNATGKGLTDDSNPSKQSTSGTHSKIKSGVYREKQKPLKSYSFVADPVLQKKDELIDGILHTLKKPDDVKMQS